MKKIISILAVIALVAAIVFFGKNNAGNSNGADTAHTGNKSTQNLKIGAIMSLTGDFGAVGENTLKGMKVAQALHKQKTGADVQLVIEDDGGDGAKGLSAYRKLTTQDGINGLINFFTTTMDTVYEPSKDLPYPMMMVAFQANNVAPDHVFQMTAGNDNTWDRFAKYIKGAGFDESKTVVVHSIDAAQASFAKTFVSEYGKPATEIVASSDKKALRSDAAKIAALKPTLIVFIMTPENGAILTKELLPLIGTSTQLVYDLQLTTGTKFYQDQLGGNLSKINGAIGLTFEGEMDSPEYKEFHDAYKAMYPNEEPGFLADYGYDTFMTYVSAYNADEAKWTNNLQATNAKGPSGDIKFDKNGIRIPPLVIKKVVGGKMETVARLPF